jgi:hypothetical protein
MRIDAAKGRQACGEWPACHIAERGGDACQHCNKSDIADSTPLPGNKNTNILDK